MKKPTSSEVAALFGVPVENVKKQYAKNAKDCRAFALKAGTGKYRGFTAEKWNQLAENAEKQAR
jgi:hypothetical protein